MHVERLERFDNCFNAVSCVTESLCNYTSQTGPLPTYLKPFLSELKSRKIKARNCHLYFCLSFNT